MSYIPKDIRRFVITRANNRCEYCTLSQAGQEATFHIENIIPTSAEGQTILENLALACVSCSLRKSARQMVFDLESSQQVPIFNPRLDHWEEHFRWNGVQVIGLTATGRATIDALDMNRALILSIREVEMILERHPPQQN